MRPSTLDEISPTLRKDRIFVHGEWREPHSAETIRLISPSTETEVATVPDGDAEDVGMAVASARRAFDDPAGWRSWHPAARADALESVADELDRRSTELAMITAHEIGRPLSSGGARRPGEILRYFADIARSFRYEELRASPHYRGPNGLQHSLIRWDPRGVTAAIAPYNGTLSLGLYKLAPTLAVGGTAVFKPPPQAPLEAYVLAEAVSNAGIPPGVLSVVPGGSATGDALVRHRGVDIVGFTGSTTAGRRIAETCGALLRPVTLELGGKSAAVILADADLDAFEAALPFIGFTFTGQNCFIHSRIVVVDSLYDEIVSRVAEVARRLVVGDPFAASTELGPLIDEAHRTFVKNHVTRALEEGAALVTGGEAPAGLSRGWYFEPTVLAEVTPDMAIARDEVFGPVLSIIRARDEEHAVEIAADSEFGLAGSIWSRDLSRANRLADRLDVGTVGINGFGFNTAAPFACRRGSGLGVELGPEGLRTYLHPKVVQQFP